MKAGKNSFILNMMPIFAVLVAILPGIIYRRPAIETAKIAVLTFLLTTAATFYIRINADLLLTKKLAKTVILLGYLGSIALLLFVPQPYLFCFWMTGGLLVSMLVDHKLGLLLHFNLSFILGISLDLEPELIIHILILGVVMSLLAGALRSMSTAIYAMIIILSTNVTLSFVINNFIFDTKVNYNYLTSLFSVFAVLVTACLCTFLYDRIPVKGEGWQEGPMAAKNTATMAAAAESAVADNVENRGDRTAATARGAGAGGNKTAATASVTQAGEDRITPTIAAAAVGDKPSAGKYSAGEAIHEEPAIGRSSGDMRFVGKTSPAGFGMGTEEGDLDSDIVIEPPEAVEADGTGLQRATGACTSYEVLCFRDNELLTRLKEYSGSLYNHSLYIGDLSARAAKMIGADEALAKAGGYYHEIGKITGNSNYIEEGLKLAGDYSFPRELKAILKEHNIKYDRPGSVEAAIVMLSDTVVSTIDYIKSTRDHRLTANKIIDNIFQMRLDKGTFDNANLSLKEFKALKEFYHTEFNSLGEGRRL